MSSGEIGLNVLMKLLVVLVAAFGLSGITVPLAISEESVDYINYVAPTREATQVAPDPYNYDEGAIQPVTRRPIVVE